MACLLLPERTSSSTLLLITDIVIIIIIVVIFVLRTLRHEWIGVVVPDCNRCRCPVTRRVSAHCFLCEKEAGNHVSGISKTAKVCCERDGDWKAVEKRKN